VGSSLQFVPLLDDLSDGSWNFLVINNRWDSLLGLDQTYDEENRKNPTKQYRHFPRYDVENFQ
jgi:hypothetical protein